MRKEYCKTFLLYAATAITAVLLFYLFFRYLLWWIFPFLIAFGVAHALQKGMSVLQDRFHFKRGIAALFCTLAVLFLLGGIILYFSSALLSEAKRFFLSLSGSFSPFEIGSRQMEKLLSFLPKSLVKWLQTQAKQSMDLLGKFAEKALAFLASFVSSLPQILLACTTAVLALFFLLTSYEDIKTLLRRNLPDKIKKTFNLLQESIFSSFGHWLHCETILCFITFLQLLLAFLLLQLPYPLLYAFLITIVDALPVFGTGTVLVPWAILSLLSGDHLRAAVLLLLFASTALVRSCLQPHLMSEKSALPPIASLLSMYLGFCSFGIKGMVFFPIFLLMGEQILRTVKRKKQVS